MTREKLPIVYGTLIEESGEVHQTSRIGLPVRSKGVAFTQRKAVPTYFG